MKRGQELSEDNENEAGLKRRIMKMHETLLYLQNKTCDNCLNWDSKQGYCIKLNIAINLGGCGDFWESKVITGNKRQKEKL